MSLFQMQFRSGKLTQSQISSALPTDLSSEIEFGPNDAFGVTGGPRTTAPQSRPASVVWNANEGIAYLGAELIPLVADKGSFGHYDASIEGNVLKILRVVDSLKDAWDFCSLLNRILPPLLSLHLHTFIWIKRFSGQIGSVAFNYEISDGRYGFAIATSETTARAMWTSLANTTQIEEEPRLMSSLYYYRQALRLSQIQPDQQSIAAEVALNLAKALEVLFSSSRDNARLIAAKMGISKDYIEQVIIPVLLLRNELDVAHVSTGPLTPEERQIVISFITRATANVGTILRQILKEAENGNITWEPTSSSLDSVKRKLIESLKQYNQNSPPK